VDSFIGCVISRKNKLKLTSWFCGRKTDFWLWSFVIY